MLQESQREPEGTRAAVVWAAGAAGVAARVAAGALVAWIDGAVKAWPTFAVILIPAVRKSQSRH